MDTERMFLTDEGFSLTYKELLENDLEVARHFIEVTRHLQEIHYLFLIFINNIDNLQKEYVLMNNGDVFYRDRAANDERDYISINSYIINIISAGRTLVESMECYINSNSNIDNEAKNKYLDFYHKIYDSSFSYRLLIRLRDYSQHGHLPVSSMQNNYRFDLSQIVDKPHYNHNKTFENQMKDIIDEIRTKYHDTPTIALTDTLAEYVVQLLSIHKMFWHQIQGELSEAYDKFQIVVSNYSDNIIKEPGALAGYFVYDVIDGNAQVVDPKGDSREMCSRFKKEAVDRYDEYAKSYKEVLSGNLFIRCSDGQISIESGENFACRAIGRCES